MASGSVVNSRENRQGVVTRFAPSPTGFLHIGGARTALFNWLFARHNGGKYLLRIEDTDRKRSTDEAIAAIFDGLDWLGLGGDDEAVYQFARSDRHAQVAAQLLDSGHAYRCYITPEDLAGRRKKAQEQRETFRLNSEWRDVGPDGHPADTPFVVRIKAPREGETVIEDMVQGRVAVQNEELDDFVILRSDGTPTYMLAVVIDDHDMAVSHVIRGDDHLNNAFRQLIVINAMNAIEGGWDAPSYGHIPLIHGADGAKMSKRHGALGVDTYRDEMGILPEAMFNYLLRLGWGHGDEDIIDREKAVSLFDIADVGKSPSRFDLAKLQHLNGLYLREADDARLTELAAARIAGDIDKGLLRAAMPVLKVRAGNLNELAESAGFLFAKRPLAFTDKAKALLTDDARERLGMIHTRLECESDWTIETLEASLKAMAAELELGLGKLAQPLRAALTGQTTSPGIFDVLVLLGRDESLARITAQAESPVGQQI